MLAPSPRAELSLAGAVVYDIETLPNAFTMNAISLADDSLDLTFEVSDFQDDRVQMLAWFKFWQEHRTIMIGFNTIGFDYPVLHYIWEHPGVSVREIYEFAMRIIDSQGGRFGFTVWESERFAPQLDLFKVHHFDNRAKSTSLKALEITMRSATVLEMPLPFRQSLTQEQIKTVLIPYNKHDVRETRRFAHFSKDAISLRLDLLNSGDLYGDVLNYSDTKIGGKLLEKRLGRNITHDENGNPRQTFRTAIPLADIILPYIRFRHPEFCRVLDRLKDITLSVDELTESIKTKGVLTGLNATVGGLVFHFGTGGIHGSVDAKRYDVRGTDWRLIDIDVTGLYPSIAIVNRFYPEHLGERFVEEYAKLPEERKQFKKGTAKNLAFKLAANGTYGNSNNRYSVFYDPKFTMSITINGQLMLCMLAEWLLSVQTLSIVQINTDGITYLVHKDYAEHAVIVRRIWERLTQLQLEEAEYGRMWIRDVNNYIAESLKGKLKQKGAYWYPELFPDDISAAACWHKDFSAIIVVRAAVAHMIHGTDIKKFITDCAHQDVSRFDFMLRAKVNRDSTLYIGQKEVQRTTRCFVCTDGFDLWKKSPPKGNAGDYKRKNGLSDYEYETIARTLAPGTWDARIHTKAKSVHTDRITIFEIDGLKFKTGETKTARWKFRDCNNVEDFCWSTLNYDYYIEQAKKLIIPG